MIFDELVTLLTFDTDAQSVARAKKFRDLLKDLADRCKSVTDAVSSAGKALGKYFAGMASSSNDIYEWARANDASAESLQRLGAAAVAMGGTIDDAKEDIAEYNLIARQMGVTVEDLLLGWARQAEGMTGVTKRLFLESRVHGVQLRQAMLEGADAFEGMMRSASVSTSSQLESSHSLVMAWRELTGTFGETMREAVTEAAPVLRELAGEVVAFLRANREMVRANVAQFFRAVAFAVKDVALWLVRAASSASGWIRRFDSLRNGAAAFASVLRIAKALLAGLLVLNVAKWGLLLAANWSNIVKAGAKLKGVIPMIGKVFKGLWAIMAAHPIAAIIAGFAALVYMTRRTEGTQRGLARVWESLRNLGRVLMRVFSPLIDLLADIGRGSEGIGERLHVGDAAISSWERLGDALGGVLNILAKLIDGFAWLLDKASEIGEAIGEEIAGEMQAGADSLTDVQQRALDALKQGRKTIYVSPDEIGGGGVFGTPKTVAQYRAQGVVAGMMIGAGAGADYQIMHQTATTPIEMDVERLLPKAIYDRYSGLSAPTAPAPPAAPKRSLPSGSASQSTVNSSVSNSGNLTINVYAPENSADSIARSVSNAVRANYLTRSQSSLIPA